MSCQTNSCHFGNFGVERQWCMLWNKRSFFFTDKSIKKHVLDWNCYWKCSSRHLGIGEDSFSGVVWYTTETPRLFLGKLAKLCTCWFVILCIWLFVDSNLLIRFYLEIVCLNRILRIWALWRCMEWRYTSVEASALLLSCVCIAWEASRTQLYRLIEYASFLHRSAIIISFPAWHSTPLNLLSGYYSPVFLWSRGTHVLWSPCEIYDS